MKKPVKNLNMHITWGKKNTVSNYVCVSVHSGVVKSSILREMFKTHASIWLVKLFSVLTGLETAADWRPLSRLPENDEMWRLLSDLKKTPHQSILIFDTT